MSVKEVEADRVGLARRFATEHGVTLVLKGWRTLVAHPDGTHRGEHYGESFDGEGWQWRYSDGDCKRDAGAVWGPEDPKGETDVASAVEAAVFLHGLGG